MDRNRIGHVQALDAATAPEPFNLFGELRRMPLTEIANGDVGAVFRQLASDGTANVTEAAADEGRMSSQIDVHRSSSCLAEARGGPPGARPNQADKIAAGEVHAQCDCAIRREPPPAVAKPADLV
jgi:hypothetical protein